MEENSPESTGCEIIWLRIEHSLRATISATLSHILTPLPLAMDLPSAQEVLDSLVGVNRVVEREIRKERSKDEAECPAGHHYWTDSCIHIPPKQMAEPAKPSEFEGNRVNGCSFLQSCTLYLGVCASDCWIIWIELMRVEWDSESENYMKDFS